MVRHITIQYVDDSTSVVSCNDFEVLRKYLQDYYDLLVIHYKNNKLVLNGDKTAIMLLKGVNMKTMKKNMSIMTETSATLSDQKQMKVIGLWRNQTNCMSTHIRKTKNVTSKLLREIQPHLNLVDQKSRQEIVKSKIISIVTYGIELYQGQTNEVKQMFCTTMNKCYRYIHGGYTLYLRNDILCKRIGVVKPEDMIRNAAILFMHKLIETK